MFLAQVLMAYLAVSPPPTGYPLVEFTDGQAELKDIAWSSLAAVSPKQPDHLQSIAIAWPAGRLQSPTCWQPANMRLNIALGPSFSVGSSIVHLVPQFDGSLVVGEPGKVWRIAAFNFANFVPFVTFSTGAVRFRLPAAFFDSPDRHDFSAPVHGVITLTCSKVSNQITCSRLAIDWELAHQFFPNSRNPNDVLGR